MGELFGGLGFRAEQLPPKYPEAGGLPVRAKGAASCRSSLLAASLGSEMEELHSFLRLLIMVYRLIGRVSGFSRLEIHGFRPNDSGLGSWLNVLR